MIAKNRAILAVLLTFLITGVTAQAEDPLGEHLFPPELLIQHQQAIGLSEAQKEFVKGEIRRVQVQFTELQWQLQDEMAKLGMLVGQEQANEGEVLNQLDKVLGIEREIKRTQFSLLLRIKNLLSPEQRARLREIKARLGER